MECIYIYVCLTYISLAELHTSGLYIDIYIYQCTFRNEDYIGRYMYETSTDERGNIRISVYAGVPVNHDTEHGHYII